jgi:hypothetical protein
VLPCFARNTRVVVLQWLVLTGGTYVTCPTAHEISRNTIVAVAFGRVPTALTSACTAWHAATARCLIDVGLVVRCRTSRTRLIFHVLPRNTVTAVAMCRASAALTIACRTRIARLASGAALDILVLVRALALVAAAFPRTSLLLPRFTRCALART